MKTMVKNHLFMATFFSDLLSNFGDVVYYLALMNYVLLLPEAKFAIALVSVSETIPLLTALLMGIWADRVKKKVDAILATLFFRLALYSIVGIMMGFKPALWIVLAAVTVNILSDLSGQFENALFTPVSLRLVAASEREAMFAFRQAGFSVFQLLFQSSGALLITMMSL
ncbi:hypothetical protein [Streptococcus catagoni]|uniref:hypothetical protein n=1 Tax=Streptococcus catagoni TaxID=2654874 RepID=UPI001F2BE4E3|nr:hypothetical protein [Streptococcus catagoni]